MYVYVYRAIESYDTICILRLMAEQICDVDQVKDTGTGNGVGLFNDAISVGLPISCVRRQASDPWLILITVGESGDGSLPGPLSDVGWSVM